MRVPWVHVEISGPLGDLVIKTEAIPGAVVWLIFWWFICSMVEISVVRSGGELWGILIPSAPGILLMALLAGRSLWAVFGGEPMDLSKRYRSRWEIITEEGDDD